MQKLALISVILLALLAMVLAACSGKAADGTGGLPTSLPMIEDVQSLALFDQEGRLVAEHRDSADLNELLEGMKAASPSYIGDPEQSGTLYELVATGGKTSRTYSVNDLRATNSRDVSVKLYAEDGERSSAWTLNSEWIDRLLDPVSDEEEPELQAIVDENDDSVTLVANRDIDRQSLEEAVRSALSIRTDESEVSAELAEYTEFTLKVTDSRRAILLLPNLPQGAAARFTLEGAKTAEGEPFRIVSSQGGVEIVVRQGLAWSGLRWVDTAGRTVREHGFDSAVLIQVANDGANDPELTIYNSRDGIVYRLNPNTDEIEDGAVPGLEDDGTGYRSDSGIDRLYSYPARADDRYRYAALGLRTVSRVDSAKGTAHPIYESERPLYGMAASPDGSYIALLAASDDFLGSYADLVVIDSEGKGVSTFKQAAYMGHSDGWHFIYPIDWVDDKTISVPLVGSSEQPFDRGTALYDYKEGFMSKEENAKLPEDAYGLLEEAIGKPGEAEILSVLPKPNDERSRYYAVTVAGEGSYLLDREEKRAMRIGTGASILWTSGGEIVAWDSTEGKSVELASLG
ncbi:hypothetical protein [Cohnella fermenti]|uniref:Lipoprotein LpqB beta-propeller domain-containing protein n=1 Tax=Cohnella fermenti TaxID=2565925 RepID=A0A4S4BNI7_9BACL|nr:hypothetical protein [Cohnella fermenti]THF76246.1 hypothetical protein E6C55_19665 [Cohnella fermenti]